MKKKAVFRLMMLTAGLLAVAVILLSPAFSSQTASVKVKTEKSQEDTAQTFVSAPTEAIPGTAVKMEDSAPSLLAVLLPSGEVKQERTSRVAKELVHYFKILFRAIISPNAP